MRADWNWMSQVELPVEKYIGGDLVPDVVAANQARFGNAHVEFRAFDLCADPLPPADLLLCRDALVHFSLADTWDAIDNILNAEIRLLATTTFPETSENIDIETGIHWRPLNLEAPPFSFPPCLGSLREGSSERQLSIWLVSDIREAIQTTFEPYATCRCRPLLAAARQARCARALGPAFFRLTNPKRRTQLRRALRTVSRRAGADKTCAAEGNWPGQPPIPSPKGGKNGDAEGPSGTRRRSPRPSWLANAHERPDRAVHAAYCWECPFELDDVLARLVALNLERSTSSGARSAAFSASLRVAATPPNVGERSITA